MKRKPFVNVDNLPVWKEEVRKVKVRPFDKAERDAYDNAEYELPEFEQICLDLWKGKRKPRNKEERAIVREMERRKKNGEDFNFKGDPF